MSLENRVKHVLENFEGCTSQQICEVLSEILLNFKSQITQDYLRGKLELVSGASDESEKKKLCSNLKPYLDWYLKGL